MLESVTSETGPPDPVPLGCAPEWDADGADGGTGGAAETGGSGSSDTGPPIPQGDVYRCQGTGNGWAVISLDIADVTACVNQPEELTLAEQLEVSPEECMSRPLDLQDLPDWDGIIEPSACCGEDSSPLDVESTCVFDCGFAACKLAVGALRNAADSVDYGKLGDDLGSFADFLEVPENLVTCAELVRNAAPNLAALNLNEGVSDPSEIGHVNNLTLYLQCALNEDEPFALDESAGTCSEPTNIPLPAPESRGGGEFIQASLTVFGALGDESVELGLVKFEFEEQHCSDRECGFTLTHFDGALASLAVGNYRFDDVEFQLHSPVHGIIAGERVVFPAGTMRFSIRADASVTGQPGLRTTSGAFEVHNATPAIAGRTRSGSFAIVDAEFAVGEDVVVLSTESAPFRPLTP